MSESASAGKEPWITQLDQEIDFLGEDTWEYDLAMILKGLFLSDGDSDAADTARKIVNYYDQKFVPSDPLMTFRGCPSVNFNFFSSSGLLFPYYWPTPTRGFSLFSWRARVTASTGMCKDSWMKIIHESRGT